VNLRRPIVTNGDFVASLCESDAYNDRAVVLVADSRYLQGVTK